MRSVGNARFASQMHRFGHLRRANLRRFQKQSANYLPQFGGYCAFGVSVGAKFDGDPTVWKVVDGKLYLNLNSDIQKSWNADIAGAVRKAETHWPKIRNTPAADLKP